MWLYINIINFFHKTIFFSYFQPWEDYKILYQVTGIHMGFDPAPFFTDLFFIIL